uniref:Uncharacterized protein n=1 Tax=Cucumis melo TaxID=3656 RepID=A0A9I9EH36_CUCME
MYRANEAETNFIIPSQEIGVLTADDFSESEDSSSAITFTIILCPFSQCPLAPLMKSTLLTDGVTGFESILLSLAGGTTQPLRPPTWNSKEATAEREVVRRSRVKKELEAIDSGCSEANASQLPSSVMGACNPSGGTEVVEGWESIARKDGGHRVRLDSQSSVTTHSQRWKDNGPILDICFRNLPIALSDLDILCLLGLLPSFFFMISSNTASTRLPNRRLNVGNFDIDLVIPRSLHGRQKKPIYGCDGKLPEFVK